MADYPWILDDDGTLQTAAAFLIDEGRSFRIEHRGRQRDWILWLDLAGVGSMDRFASTHLTRGHASRILTHG